MSTPVTENPKKAHTIAVTKFQNAWRSLVERIGRPTRTAIPLHFITPVWGGEYSRLFVELCLPTLLSPGNIPALAQTAGCVYHIFTTLEDARYIENSPAFRTLSRHIRVAVHRVTADASEAANPYHLQSECYRRGIAIGDKADAAMIFVNADVVMADGGVRALRDLVESGKRAVLAMGVRLNKHAAAVEIAAGRLNPADGTIAISAADLTKIAVVNLHQISRMHLYNGVGERFHPAGLFWAVERDGLLMRCFHLHPLLVYPKRKDAPFTTSIDNDYLMAACPDLGDLYIVQDSEELLACELSEDSRQIEAPLRNREDIDIARWAYFNANPQHREYVKIPIRMRAGDATTPAWTAALDDSNRVVDRVLAYLDDPDLVAKPVPQPPQPAPPSEFVLRLRAALAAVRDYEGKSLGALSGLHQRRPGALGGWIDAVAGALFLVFFRPVRFVVRWFYRGRRRLADIVAADKRPE
jgi:hypothetical protein